MASDLPGLLGRGCNTERSAVASEGDPCRRPLPYITEYTPPWPPRFPYGWVPWKS